MTSRTGNEENGENKENDGAKNETTRVLWYDELGWGRREKFEPWLVASFTEDTKHVLYVSAHCSICLTRFDTVLIETSRLNPSSQGVQKIGNPAYPNSHDACASGTCQSSSLIVECVLEHWEHLGKGTWARRDNKSGDARATA